MYSGTRYDILVQQSMIMRLFFAYRPKSLFIPGCVQGAIFSLSVCVLTFVVSADCESCTGPIPTNPGSMEAGEYGLTRGTCFVASCLEVVAVAELLWISWCVLGAAGFRGGFFRFFFFERTRPGAASMRPPCLIYLPTSIMSTTGYCNLYIWYTAAV